MNCRKRRFAFRLCWKDMLPVYLLTIVFKNYFSICKVLRTKLVLPLMFEDYTSVQILSKSPALTTRQLQAPQTSPAAQTFAKEVTFLGKPIAVTNFCSLCDTKFWVPHRQSCYPIHRDFLDSVAGKRNFGQRCSNSWYSGNFLEWCNATTPGQACSQLLVHLNIQLAEKIMPACAILKKL